ncbi:Phenylalanyl-tRNA synthetase beta chain [Candidatus Karelsulcia muelleri]|nr:Phenylalanyl-tRNA synthetase beta chain [Candidatus Karelsulcia muelleri]
MYSRDNQYFVVNKQTKNLFIESAYYAYASICKKISFKK